MPATSSLAPAAPPLVALPPQARIGHFGYDRAVNGVVTPSYRSAQVRGAVVVQAPLAGAGLPA